MVGIFDILILIATTLLVLWLIYYFAPFFNNFIPRRLLIISPQRRVLISIRRFERLSSSADPPRHSGGLNQDQFSKWINSYYGAELDHLKDDNKRARLKLVACRESIKFLQERLSARAQKFSSSPTWQMVKDISSKAKTHSLKGLVIAILLVILLTIDSFLAGQIIIESGKLTETIHFLGISAEGGFAYMVGLFFTLILALMLHALVPFNVFSEFRRAILRQPGVLIRLIFALVILGSAAILLGIWGVTGGNITPKDKLWETIFRYMWLLGVVVVYHLLNRLAESKIDSKGQQPDEPLPTTTKIMDFFDPLVDVMILVVFPLVLVLLGAITWIPFLLACLWDVLSQMITHGQRMRADQQEKSSYRRMVAVDLGFRRAMFGLGYSSDQFEFPNLTSNGDGGQQVHAENREDN